jgi:IclR family pca regulon transcriptional regulator
MRRITSLDENSRDRAGRYHVEALARGLAILSAFSAEDPWLGLSEVARRVNLSTATALRLLRTLERLGYVEQAPDTKKYRPGLAVLRLGYAAIAGLGLRERSLPYLQRLSDELGETVNLAVLAGSEIVYIERIKRTELITANIHVGSRLPAYSTSMGKVLLAFLTPAQRAAVLTGVPLVATGPNTITDRARLEAELAGVRRLGYALQDEELVAGLRSVAAPIRNESGEVIAAINVAVPAGRVPRRVLEERIAPRVVATAAEISAALGFRGLAATVAAAGPSGARMEGGQ